MTFSFLQIPIFLLLCTLSLAKNPAGSLNITKQGITNLKNHILPAAITKILSLPLPDIYESFLIYSVNVTQLTIKQLNLNSSDISIDLINGKIVILVQNVAVKIQGNLELSPGGQSGTLYIDVGEISVQVSATFSLNSANQFQVTLSDTNVNIGTFTLTMDGSFFIKIIDQLIPLFDPIIKGQVQKQIESALQTQVPNLINQLLASIPEDIQLPLPPIVPFGLHIEPVSAPNVDSSSIDVDLFAYLYDYFLNKTEPPIPDPEPFVPSPTQKQFGLTVSQYIVNSAFNALKDMNVMETVIINIPGLNTTVKTDYIDYFLPGVVNQFGLNQMVIFLCSIPVAPEIDFMHPLYDITLQLNATCDIQPIEKLSPVTVGKLVLTLNVSLNAEIDNGLLSVNFTQAECENLDIIDTNFTKANLDYLQDTLNLGLMFGVKVIEPTLALPEFQGINFNDTELSFGDGFIRIETNPDLSGWVPPTFDSFESFYEGFKWVSFLKDNSVKKFLKEHTVVA